MFLILLIDLIVVATLVTTTRRRLEDGLPALCFFLILVPFESRLVIPGLFDLTTERVAILTLLALFLLRSKRTDRQPLPLRNLILVHVSSLLCSTVLSLSTSTSLKQLLSQVIEYYLLYYIFVKSISDLRTIERILYGMTVAAAICCMFGLFEAYGSWSILSLFPSDLWTTYTSPETPLYIEWGRGLRIRSTFPHPILLGDGLAMCIPIAFYLLGSGVKGKRRWIVWMCLLLMFWGVYKTSSRGPWIAVIVSCALLFFVLNNRVRRYLFGIAILSAVALVARPGIWETIVNLYTATFDSASIIGSSYEYRHEVMQAVQNAVASDPLRALFGFGPGSFRVFGLEVPSLDGPVRRFTCDNNWALLLYESGYIGLILIALLLAKPLILIIRQYRSIPRPSNNFLGVCFICLGNFYFALLSVAGYNWGQQGFIAWMLISLSIVYPKLTRQSIRVQASGKVSDEQRARQSHRPYDEHSDGTTPELAPSRT